MHICRPVQWLLLLVVWACVGLAGCWSSTPPALKPPSLDPTAAAKEAMETYDTNRDGVISGEELDKCPALKSALARYDTAGDKKITAENIAARLSKWQETKTAVTKLGIRARLDGQPLADCTVTAEPEAFLGPDFKSATGVTDKNGSIFTLQSPGKMGVSPGLYKLRFSKMAAGKETIPAKYNTATQLGVEVAQDNPEYSSGGLTFNLTSK